MRYLHHPDIKEVTVEGVLYALSDPVRAHILLQLTESSCAQNCTSLIEYKGKPLPKSTLSQHLRILRESGLIRSEKIGVELKNTPRCKELQKKFGSLVEMILQSYLKQVKPKKVRK